MAGRIPRSFIDDLLNRVDIVDVIDGRVPLKKKGHDYWACCPFHGEKTPSFSVSPGKQFYHCFGCQKSGNAVGFLMDYDHMEFVEAIEYLAGTLAIEVPYEQGSRPQDPGKQQLEPLFKLMERCADFYQAALRESTEAIDYLKQRGIGGQTAKDYGIGYAPPGWNNIDGDRNLLAETGMVVLRHHGKHYDRFRHRLMFPIRDRRGRCIAFGGRVINPQDNPKYMNSPESRLFHKGEEIYGLHEMKSAVTNIERIYVTEGYMDVVALAEQGVRTAVATLGTAINNHQVESLFRVCRQLVFCFDGDEAGRKAAWRALEASLASLKEGRLARFLFLPDGQDPDSYIREFGRDAFEGLADTASTLTTLLFDTLLAECNLATIEGRAQFLDRLRPYFSEIPLQSLKDQILAEVEQHLGQRVDARLLRLLGEREEPPRASPARAPETHWTPTRLAINLLLKQPSLARGVGRLDDIAESDIAGVDLLLRLIDAIDEDPDIGTAALLERFRGDEHENHLYRLAAMAPPIADDDSLNRMFQDCLQQLQKQYIDHRWKRLISILDAKRLAGEEPSEQEKLELRHLSTRRT